MKYIILGHTNPDIDSIISGYLLEKLLKKLNYNVEFVIPDIVLDKEVIDVCNKYDINYKKCQRKLNDDDKYIILVDNYDRIVNGEVVAIIDHHPTDKVFNIKNYYNTNISSTALYIVKNNYDYFDSNDIKLAILATMIDTVSFHSSKGTKEDYLWIKNECQKKMFNFDELYNDGLYLTPLNTSIDKLSLNELKTYHYVNGDIQSSCIKVKIINDRVDEIINFLKDYQINNNMLYFIFIVYDMTNFKTKVYIINDNDIEIINYDNYMSRGSVIIPDIIKKYHLQER